MQNRENERAEDEENETEGSKKAADEDGGRVQYSIDPGFAKAIDEWDGKKDTTFRLGSTSKALQSIGVKDTGIIWHSAKIRKILHDHPEMSRNIIKQVPNILEKPVMVLQSKNSDSRIVMLGEVYDEAGNLVTAVLELQPTTKGGQIQDMTVVVSAYGKNDSPQNFVVQSNLLYVDPNKQRTKRWMQGLGLQLPSDTTALGSIGNISYHDGKVKINSIPYKQYMQTTREDVGYTTKVPPTKSPGQLAYEKALAEKAERDRKAQEKQVNGPHSEDDNSVSDRELLLEAAEREGAGEELRRYAQKARNLEAYQKRLERQQKMLGEMKTESPSLADASQQAGIVARSPRVAMPPLGKGALQALEKRISETEKLIANTQTAMAEKNKAPKTDVFGALRVFAFYFA